jgi:hypothetical protein
MINKRTLISLFILLSSIYYANISQMMENIATDIKMNI